MIRYILLLFFFFGLLIAQKGINPCENERYLKLIGKSLDEMSEREFAYFTKYDDACNEYNQGQNNILKGFKINLYSGMPIVYGKTFNDYNLHQTIALNIITPAGFKIGPFFTNIGMELFKYNFISNDKVKNDYRGDVFLISLITGITYKGYSLHSLAKSGIFQNGQGLILSGGMTLPINSPLSFDIFIRGNIIPKIDIRYEYTGWSELGFTLNYIF